MVSQRICRVGERFCLSCLRVHFILMWSGALCTVKLFNSVHHSMFTTAGLSSAGLPPSLYGLGLALVAMASWRPCDAVISRIMCPRQCEVVTTIRMSVLTKRKIIAPHSAQVLRNLHISFKLIVVRLRLLHETVKIIRVIRIIYAFLQSFYFPPPGQVFLKEFPPLSCQNLALRDRCFSLCIKIGLCFRHKLEVNNVYIQPERFYCLLTYRERTGADMVLVKLAEKPKYIFKFVRTLHHTQLELYDFKFSVDGERGDTQYCPCSYQAFQSAPITR